MRKLAAAALALTVAGGVYLVAGTAEASNMGFKLERQFSVQRFAPGDPAHSLLNHYLVSFPLFNGLGDVAQSTGPVTNGNRCVGDAGSTAAPDGIIDSTDALCDLWTSRQGSMSINHFNRDTCLFESQLAKPGLTPGTFSFGAPLPGGLERDAGYQIDVGVNGTPASLPQNQAVIVGSHDPSYTGRTIRFPSPACVPSQDLINLPYHSMYQKATELLCGLDGVDFTRDPVTGFPQTCPSMTATSTGGGIFDGGIGPTHAISVTTFVNDPLDPNANQYVPCLVRRGSLPPNNLAFGCPTDFLLKPGDAYIVQVSTAHTPTIFLSPHF